MKIFQFLVIMCMASLSMTISTSYYQIENLNELAYDYEENALMKESLCKCQNDGICVIDHDFCVCSPNFTGRRCEISINVVASRQGCGRLSNGETEFLDCAKCTCTNKFLTLNSISTLKTKPTPKLS